MSQITEKVKIHRQKGNDVHLFANVNFFLDFGHKNI